ncbi:ABC transporter substrate-binding protein [Humitalea rosea]|nr:ABC transporter substrate-binding protein [Humitalea rosea]
MNDITRRGALGATGAAAAAALLPPQARAQASRPIRIGVLSDFSGAYRDYGGEGSTACVRQAIEDLKLGEQGIEVEILKADHQNKPDVALSVAREWFDRRDVDMVCDLNNTSVALAVGQLAREKNKVVLATATASAVLTGEQCSSNLIHWTYDTYMLSKSTATATVAAGGNSWFFIVVNYAFGHQMQADATRFVEDAGGRVLGAIRYPFPQTTDFSSFLVQAQSSGAKVLGLATGGADTTNCVKQAQEFGLLRRGMRVAVLLSYITDVHALGLPDAQGMLLTEAFYWDLNDRTRAFTRRLHANVPDLYPNHQQAGAYSAAIHYLRTAAAMGVDAAKADGLAVVNRMKATPTDDDVFGPGSIRADGRKIHPAYLFEVKTPAESRGPWDYYKLAATTPAEQAFRPVSEGGCALVK